MNNGVGVILCAVPNSHSLHRQIAVKMGILENENSLNETDIKNGHRRVYNYNSLKNDFFAAGLKIKFSGGYWLKPLSNSQIDDFFTPQMNNSFIELGELYPEIAAEIYIVATISD